MNRLVSMIAIALVCTLGYGARKYGMSGCGLGNYVVDADAGGFAHAFGDTTNVTVASQFFGIISGTSNCEPDEFEKKAMNQQQFVTHNLASLAKEIAQGEGTTLAAFTEALGCSSNVESNVRVELKSNASEILAAPGALAVLETAKAKLRGNPDTNLGCKFLS